MYSYCKLAYRWDILTYFEISILAQARQWFEWTVDLQEKVKSDENSDDRRFERAIRAIDETCTV